MSKRYHKPSHKTESKAEGVKTSRAEGVKAKGAEGAKSGKAEGKKAKKSAAQSEEETHEEVHAESASEDQSHSDSAEESSDDTHADHDSHNSEETKEKVRLEFFGSDIIRAQAPEVMKIADSIAEDWVHDGDFDKIPVGNPIAQAVVGKGLRKAKEVEKKLEEKGVFLMARMGADYLKSKINKR